MDELGRLLAARGDAEEGAHPHLLALGPVVDPELEPALAGDLGRRLRQVGRGDLVGGGIDEVAGERGGLGECRAEVDRRLELAAAARVGLDEAELLHAFVRLLPLVPIEAVGPEERAADHGPGPLSEGQRVAEHLDRDDAGAEIARPSHPGGGRAPDGLQRELPARPEPDDHHPLRGQTPVRVQVRELARLALELLRLEHLNEPAAERAVEARQRFREPLLVRVAADDQHIAVGRGQRLREQGHSHSLPPWETATARRIMSTRPAVVSNRSTSEIGTQHASAASLPAWTGPPSGRAAKSTST